MFLTSGMFKMVIIYSSWSSFSNKTLSLSLSPLFELLNLTFIMKIKSQRVLFWCPVYLLVPGVLDDQSKIILEPEIQRVQGRKRQSLQYSLTTYISNPIIILSIWLHYIPSNLYGMVWN